jgi:hypothetical protein
MIRYTDTIDESLSAFLIGQPCPILQAGTQ